MIGTSLPYVATPNFQKMRDLCDVALDTPNGLKMPFDIKNYGSLEACKKAARAFQQLFSSFRARARNTVQMRAKQRIDELGEQIQSPYDKLACMRVERPDGIDVFILPSVAFEIAHEILDAKTGEPIKIMSPEVRRQEAYIKLIFDRVEKDRREGTRSPTPLSIDQELDAFALNEQLFAELYEKYKWKLKSTGLPYGVQPTSTDVLDTSMDDFGVSTDGEV